MSTLEETRRWVQGLNITSLQSQPEKLAAVSGTLRTSLMQMIDDLDNLQAAVSRNTNLDSLWVRPDWNRAEQDWPAKPEFGCFSTRTPEVLVFDTEAKKFSNQNMENLRGKPVIFCRLPSRLSRTIFVWATKEESARPRPLPRYMVTKDSRQPNGVTEISRINLAKISSMTRVKILTGHIKWLFIVSLNSKEKQSLRSNTDESTRKAAQSQS